MQEKVSGKGTRLSGTNLERAADHNQRITLHAIRVHGTMTRVEIARLTGLTAPAIANITRKLINDDLIRELGRVRNGRGQPATKYGLNSDACYSIGVNIDRDHLTIVIVNFGGETIAQRTRDCEFPLPTDVQRFYSENVKDMMREVGLTEDRIVGLGVAVPDDLGRVDLPGRPSAYAEWEVVDMADIFAGPVNVPMFIENDAAAAAMGEQQLGSGHHFGSIFYVLISRGLGGGLIVDGNYVRGADGRSGEIGFLHHRTGFGRSEQVQHLVSLAGLAKLMKDRDLELSLIFAPDPNPAVDRAVDEWLGMAVERLSEPLMAINCLINPGAVLLSGRLPARYLDRLALKLNKHLRERASLMPAIAPVKRATLSEDAPAVGAAILPFSHFLLPKAGALWKMSAEEAQIDA